MIAFLKCQEPAAPQKKRFSFFRGIFPTRNRKQCEIPADRVRRVFFQDELLCLTKGPVKTAQRTDPTMDGGMIQLAIGRFPIVRSIADRGFPKQSAVSHLGIVNVSPAKREDGLQGVALIRQGEDGIFRKTLAASGTFKQGQKTVDLLDNLIDNDQKYPITFVMALKEFRRSLTSRARCQITGGLVF